MLLEIQGKAFNPQQVVSMVKDTKYNNMGNATLYRLRVQMEHEAFEFIYPNDIQSRDKGFDKIIDAANSKQVDDLQMKSLLEVRDLVAEWKQKHDELFGRTDAPQMKDPKCDNCKYYQDGWYSAVCDDCMAGDEKPIRYEPQTDCETCRHYKLACELFSEVCKYEPITQTETQSSNTDTPQTERDM